MSDNFLKRNPGIWDLDSLRVSLYGVDSKSYKFTTTIDKSFEIVKKNTINFLKLRKNNNKNLKFGFNFIVIPENVDAIRALMGIEGDWKKSVEKTDNAIAAYNGL